MVLKSINSGTKNGIVFGTKMCFFIPVFISIEKSTYLIPMVLIYLKISTIKIIYLYRRNAQNLVSKGTNGGTKKKYRGINSEGGSCNDWNK